MQQPTDHKGPLAGIKVIDFGHYYAGPMAAMLLADQGATVIRIVRPGKPELIEQQYRLLNRNKKLLTLDLKTDEGKKQALALIERADVVIENFRPGVMKRLGLDYPSVKQQNPKLVYLSLPGFSSTDKKRRHIQAWEGILGAAAGVYTDISLFRQALKFPPLYTAIPHCSIYGALHGVIAVIAALIARDKYGLGTVIETPLVNAGLSAFAVNVLMPSFFSAKGKGLTDSNSKLAFSSEDSRDIQAEKLDNAARQNMGMFGPFGGFFSCADGRMIFIWVSGYPILSERYLKALGIDQQVKREGFSNCSPWVPGLDNNLSSPDELSIENKRRLHQMIDKAFLTKTAYEWEPILEKARVPFTVVRTRNEWLGLKPMLESGVLVRMKNENSELIVPGPLADVSGPYGASARINPSEPVVINERQAVELLRADAITNTSDIKDKRQQDELHRLNKGDFLRNVKILDLSDVLAGPTASYVLAQYGAEVIKLDAVNYKMHPFLVYVYMELNQGKRSLLADLKTEPGQKILHKLVSWADVVVHNSLDDVAQRLGVSGKQLKAINPNVVSTQLSAFGGPSRGGWETRLGYDPVAQCASGLTVQFGTVENPHTHHMSAAADTMGGLSLAFTALLGVYQQRTTGYAGEGRTSLVRAVNHYQLPYLVEENGQCDWGEAKGQFSLGEKWWQRMYACHDGWIYVGTTQARTDTLLEVVAQEQLHAKTDTAVERILENAFRQKSAEYWLTQLGAADIACHLVVSSGNASSRVRCVSNDESIEGATDALEILRRENHPCGYPLDFLAPDHVTVGEDHTYKLLTPAPRFGGDTAEILKELGFQKAEIDDLIRLGVVQEYIPAIGNKDSYFLDISRKDDIP